MTNDFVILRKFYQRALKSENLTGVFIPRSDVHYVRRAIYERTGEWYELEHVVISMWLEGCIPPNDVTSIPEWYVTKYMEGKMPQFSELKEEVVKKYKERLIRETVVRF
jgi:hypothetical protein